MGSYKILTMFFVLSILILLPVSIFGGTSYSTNQYFNVTPNTTFLNWTNSYSVDLTIGMNTSWGIVSVKNESTGANRHTVEPNYSQPNNGVLRTYTDECGFSGVSFLFYVKNSTNNWISTTQNLTQGETENLTLFSGKNESCPPGFYWGYIRIENSSDSSEYYSLPVSMHIPITSSNELNVTTRTGYFKGKMPANATNYQSYFFNTTEVPNATSVTITLSWANYNQDLDLFLFDSSGNLREKSINTGTSESLTYQYLPQNEIWEIRIFGNSTSEIDYTSAGSLYFSTLNVTNVTDNSQISSIDFGEKNVSDVATAIFKLKNEGQTNLTSVTESSELYHKETRSGSAASNFTFRVPDFTTKIKTEINWTGSANYTLRIYKPDGTLYGSSTDKHTNANVTGAMQEEYLEYNPSGTVGLSDDGLWKVEVLNNTASLNSYTLTIKEWINASNWVSTNYSTMNINAMGESNDSVIVEFNLTVQNKSLSGLYEGNIKYASDSSVIKVPFSFNVTTGELFVNNSFNSSTLIQKDNTGFNKTVLIQIPINNTGNMEINLSNSLNSTFLNYSTYYMNFSYEYPSFLSSGSSDTLNISVTLDTSKTGDQAGVYTGWLWLNSTNASPYDGFNLTINFNLSQYLDVYLRQIQTSDGDSWIETPGNGENITLIAEVFLMNGTELTDLDVSNFTSVYLSNKNVSYTIPSSGYLNLSNYTMPLYRSLYGQYWINASLSGSSTRPGGYYNVYMTATEKAGTDLQGTTYNGTLIINNSGLYLSTDDSTFWITEGTSGDEYFNLSVVNYGPKEAAGRITLNSSDSDCDYVDIDSKDAKSDCYASKSSDYFVVSISEGEECWFRWRFTADNVSDDVTCSAQIVIDDPGFNSQGVTIHVENIESSSSNEGSESGGSQDEEIAIGEHPSSLSIAQGENKSFIVNVENIGDVDEDDITLEITGISSSWYTFTPTSMDLGSLTEDDFNVTVSVPDDAEVKEYSITFEVSNDDVSDSETAKLLVMPSEKTKSDVDSKYESYLENFTDLENKMKEMIREGRNVTELNDTLQNLKSKLDTLGELINNSDYFNAVPKLDEIESLLTVANSLVTQVEKETPPGLLQESSSYVWIFIGVLIIVIAGFLIYMFMPSPKETFVPKKFKYVPPGSGEPITKRIIKQIKKIRMKIRSPKRKDDKGWKKKRKGELS